MKVTIVLEDTPKGITYNCHCAHNDVANTQAESLAFHVAMNMTEVVAQSKRAGFLHVDLPEDRYSANRSVAGR